MTEDSKARDLDLEWENRVLCSDESCIGTIGPDGRCRECGRPYNGILPDRTETGPTHEAAANGDREAGASGESHASTSAGDKSIGNDSDSVTSVTDDEWESRTLCPDESCIGIIGPDGSCKECGKRL
jgi:hypothetical protein